MTAGGGGWVDLRHVDRGTEIGGCCQHDPVLTKGGDDVLDVSQERRRRTDEEHRAGQVRPLGVQEVRGAVERHCCLACARRPLHDRHAGAGATDHDILLGLDRCDDVVHATGPRRIERSHECALAHEVEPGLARGGDVEDFVLQPDELAVSPTEVASAHDAHGVLGQGPVERLGGRRTPVDDERVAVLVSDRHATDVEAAAVREVESTYEQAVFGDVEGSQPVAGMGDGAVALEEGLRTPGLSEPGRAGHTLSRAAHGQDSVVGSIEVRALEPKLVVTEHVGDSRCEHHWKQAAQRSYNWDSSANGFGRTLSRSASAANRCMVRLTRQEPHVSGRPFG